MNLATVSKNPFFARRDTFALCCAGAALQPCFAKDASAALWSPEGIWGLRQCWVNWWSWECNWRLADSTNGMGNFFGPYCWRKIGSHDVCAVRLAMSTQTETSGEPCTAIRARVPRGHVPNYSRSLSEYCIGPGFRLLLVLLSRHIISLIRLARLIRQPSKGQVNLPCISMHRPCFHQIRAVCLIDVFLRLAILGHPPFGQTHLSHLPQPILFTPAPNFERMLASCSPGDWMQEFGGRSDQSTS